jgi:uncharacterized damage-inducible protein DinB
MTSAELVADAFDRVRQIVHRSVEGLSAAKLSERPGREANSIAWLIWHLTRIQDDHLADVAGAEQTWLTGGWVERFDLPFDAGATGYGHSPEDVAAVRADAELLLGYHDAVHQATLAFVGGLSDADLDRVVDTNWDPPVTLGVRLVSVISDDLQHAGQAAYASGLLDRRS